jgi:hypothetical protein
MVRDLITDLKLILDVNTQYNTLDNIYKPMKQHEELEK